MTVETAAPGLRERILEQATPLFIKQGYQGLSMREIAAAVGVSKAGLYYHFKDKEALFLAILLTNIESLGKLVHEVRESGGSFRAQLRGLLLGIATRMHGSQAIMRLAEQDAVHLSPDAREQLYRTYHQAFIGQVQAALQEAQSQGEVKRLPPEKLTRLLLGMAYPLLSTPAEEAEASVKLLLTVFFEGAGVD
jgi:AcrR family transcriptional regulator